MKITLAAVTAIAGLLVADQASAAVVKFKATLNGVQETPPVTTTSTGTADLDFDDAAKTLSGVIELQMEKLDDVSNQHIHLAECGKAGNILRPLTPPGMNGVIAIDPSAPITLDDSGVQALNEGRLYINIHTKTNPGGEIRGQIYKEGSPDVCPSTAGGDDAGASDDGGASSSGGTSSSGGASTPDAGTPEPAATDDDGGCSTTGSSSSSNGVVLASGLGIALAIGAASRRKTRAARKPDEHGTRS